MNSTADADLHFGGDGVATRARLAKAEPLSQLALTRPSSAAAHPPFLSALIALHSLCYLALALPRPRCSFHPLSYTRSPWTNAYDPPLADGTTPSPKLRKLESAMGDAFDVYRDM